MAGAAERIQDPNFLALLFQVIPLKNALVCPVFKQEKSLLPQITDPLGTFHLMIAAVPDNG